MTSQLLPISNIYQFSKELSKSSSASESNAPTFTEAIQKSDITKERHNERAT